LLLVTKAPVAVVAGFASVGFFVVLLVVGAQGNDVDVLLRLTLDGQKVATMRNKQVVSEARCG
jgi:hypothetical protein